MRNPAFLLMISSVEREVEPLRYVVVIAGQVSNQTVAQASLLTRSYS